MGDVSPIPAKNIDPKRFDSFKSDLALLLNLVTQDELGKRMGVSRSNVNKYVRGNLPVTSVFFDKFYAVWGNRIKEEKDKIRLASSIYPPSHQAEEPSMRDIMTILQRIETKIDRQADQPK
jgi:transcriptional regulator with XRE-family HTH domain